MKTDITELQQRWEKANSLEEWEKFAIEMCPNAAPDVLKRDAWECHERFEHGRERKIMLEKAKKYLQSKYENWNEEDLIYKKY